MEWSGLNACLSKLGSARCRIYRYADLESFTLNNSGVVELLENASFEYGRVGVHMIASTCIEGIAFVPVR